MGTTHNSAAGVHLPKAIHDRHAITEADMLHEIGSFLCSGHDYATFPI
jgi:hypothetical protein